MMQVELSSSPSAVGVVIVVPPSPLLSSSASLSSLSLSPRRGSKEVDSRAASRILKGSGRGESILGKWAEGTQAPECLWGPLRLPEGARRPSDR